MINGDGDVCLALSAGWIKKYLFKIYNGGRRTGANLHKVIVGGGVWHVSGSVREGNHLNSLSVVMPDWSAFIGRSVYRPKTDSL